MTIKPIVAAIASITVASASFAAQNPYKHSAVQSSQICAMNSIAQGNSIFPTHQTMKILNKKLLVGGLVNLDTYWSNKTDYTSVPQFYAHNAGGSSSSIYLNNANLFLGSDLGFAHARVNIGYFNGLTQQAPNLPSASHKDRFTLDEAYVTFSNFAESPLYVKVGKYYQQIGRYNPYQLVPDLTTLFTQVNGTGGEVGYVGANGLYANIAGFSASGTSINSDSKRNRVNDFDIKAGYNGYYSGATFGVSASYLHNAKDLAFANSPKIQSIFDHSSRASVYSATGHLDFNHFDACVKYARINLDTIQPEFDHPWALGFNAGYTFNSMHHKSRIGLGYQMTRHAAIPLATDMSAPKSRYLVDYKVGLNKYVNVAVAYYYDKSYGKVVGVEPKADNSNTLLGRVSVSF